MDTKAYNRIARLGDEINQCLQIILTTAGNWRSIGSDRFTEQRSTERYYATVETAVRRAAKAIVTEAEDIKKKEEVTVNGRHVEALKVWYAVFVVLMDTMLPGEERESKLKELRQRIAAEFPSGEEGVRIQ